jgi:AcrR family transcriptional regulator
LEETKKIILQAASQAFQLKGIRNMKMSDLAGILGMSKKTIYTCFDSKHQMLSEIFQQELQHIDSTIKEYVGFGQNAIEEVFKVFITLSDYFKTKNPERMGEIKQLYPRIYGLFQEFKDHKLLANFKQNMERGINEGVYRNDIHVLLTGKLYLNMVESITDPSLDPIMPHFSNRYYHVFRYHMRGICSESGWNTWLQLELEWKHQIPK